MGRGRLLRTALRLVLTFVGITLATFAVVDLAARALDPEADEESFSLAARLSLEDQRRIREELQLDLPALINTDVQDRRRFVESEARALARLLGPLVERTTRETKEELRRFGTSEQRARPAELAHSLTLALAARLTSAIGRREEGTWAPVLDGVTVGDSRSLRRARRGPGPRGPHVNLDAWLELLARGRRLAGFGGMTIRHLAGALEGLPAEGRRLLLALAANVLGQPVGSPEDLRAAARDPALQKDTVREAVGLWARLVEKEEQALQAVARGDAPATRAELERLRAERRSVEQRALAPAGGLAVPALMELLLEREDPYLRHLGVTWMAAHAGWEGSHPWPFATPGAGTPEAEEVMEHQDRDLRARWRRVGLRYREIGPIARWAWHSWTATRYAGWLSRIARLDFGDSVLYRRPVVEMLGLRIVPTLVLQGTALLLMFLIAVPVGVWMAVTPRRWLERGCGTLLVGLYALPDFWIASLAVLYMGDHLPVHGLLGAGIDARVRDGSLDWWSPEVLADAARHLVLPVSVLTYGGLAVLARFARSGLLETLEQEFIQTFRALGLGRMRIVLRHGLRNSLLPLVTILGGLLPAVAGGSIVVENVFNIPGMGRLAWEAATRGDVPLAMGIITVVGVLTMLGYALTDVVHGLLDPRTRRTAG